MSSIPGQKPFLIFAVVAGIAAAFFLGLSLGRHDGAAPSISVDAGPDQQRIALPTDIPSAPADGASTAFVYCAPCHRPDGKGIPGIFPPLAGNQRLLGDDRLIVALVLCGYDSQSDPTAPRWAGRMGPMAHLSDEQLANALSFARNAWGNHGSIISAATVTEVRARFATREKPWTPAALSQAFAPIQ